jgi:hypothetical protein
LIAESVLFWLFKLLELPAEQEEQLLLAARKIAKAHITTTHTYCFIMGSA